MLLMLHILDITNRAPAGQPSLLLRRPCLNKYAERLRRSIETNVLDKLKIFHLKSRKNVSHGIFNEINKK